MADVTHAKIDAIDAIEGVLDGIKMHRAAAGLGVSAFGISIVDLDPGADQFRLDPDHIIRVGPSVKRKVTPGPEGLRLLAMGATPGEAYDTGGTL